MWSIINPHYRSQGLQCRRGRVRVQSPRSSPSVQMVRHREGFFSLFLQKLKKKIMSDCSCHLHMRFFFSRGKGSAWGSWPGVCGAAEQCVVVNVITPLGQSDNPPLRLSLDRRKVLWHIKRSSTNMALTGGSGFCVHTVMASAGGSFGYSVSHVKVKERLLSKRSPGTALHECKSQSRKETRSALASGCRDTIQIKVPVNARKWTFPSAGTSQNLAMAFLSGEDLQMTTKTATFEGPGGRLWTSAQTVSQPPAISMSELFGDCCEQAQRDCRAKALPR